MHLLSQVKINNRFHLNQILQKNKKMNFFTIAGVDWPESFQVLYRGDILDVAPDMSKIAG